MAGGSLAALERGSQGYVLVASASDSIVGTPAHALSQGTAQENTTVTQTVLDTATLKERTLAFNYASLALNNSFFLDQLVCRYTPLHCHPRAHSP